MPETTLNSDLIRCDSKTTPLPSPFPRFIGHFVFLSSTRPIENLFAARLIGNTRKFKARKERRKRRETRSSFFLLFLLLHSVLSPGSLAFLVIERALLFLSSFQLSTFCTCNRYIHLFLPRFRHFPGRHLRLFLFSRIFFTLYVERANSNRSHEVSDTRRFDRDFNLERKVVGHSAKRGSVFVAKNCRRT